MTTTTTAVDSNILFDVFSRDSTFKVQSIGQLQDALNRGVVLVCDVVYAELAPSFGSRADLDEALLGLDLKMSPIDTDIAYEAGQRWGRYRRTGGPRSRILADFLIGAHAVLSADTFLTRDDGFYQTYFPELSRPPGSV